MIGEAERRFSVIVEGYNLQFAAKIFYKSVIFGFCRICCFCTNGCAPRSPAGGAVAVIDQGWALPTWKRMGMCRGWGAARIEARAAGCRRRPGRHSRRSDRADAQSGPIFARIP
jgi:hypothetical protein